MKDEKKKSREALESKFQLYLAGLSPELAEQLRALYRLAVPETKPDEEELALQEMVKELVVLKKTKKSY